MSSTFKDSSDEDKTVILRKSGETATFQTLSTDHGEIDLFKIDPKTRRSFIDKTAYAKLHRSFSAGNNRRSVGNLKDKYENNQTNEIINISEDKDSTTLELSQKPKRPISENLQKPVIYPAVSSKPVPLPKPRHLLKNKPKDVNSNVVLQKSHSIEEESTSDFEERPVIIRTTASQDSIDKIAKELSFFTMDPKKDRKRMNGIRKLFSGSLFKDKNKREEEKNRQKQEHHRKENLIYNDNFQNETNHNKQTPSAPNGIQQRREPPVSFLQTQPPKQQPFLRQQLEINPEKLQRLEQEYAEQHRTKFQQARQNFLEQKQDYLPMDRPKKKPTIADYISAPVQKYIDTSSSASSEPERPSLSRKPSDIRRDTPPRAQETYQNINLIKPRASIPINSERSLPNPYQNLQREESTSRTIERNLDKSDIKNYSDKNTIINNKPQLDDTYGTVFDSLEYVAAKNGEMKPMNGPKSPSFEVSKLRLPPNREIYDLQPRVRSPIPSNRVSTDKIIATELLRNSRSPTPQKKMEEMTSSKPPMPPLRALERKPSDNSLTGQENRVVTNAVIHMPHSQTAPELRNSISSMPRSPTPLDLRMAASLKLSPQKPDIRRSVEEYYWKELKKMKDREDYSIYMMSNGFYEDPRVRRSRSLSPSSHRYGRRSLSLPRDSRPPAPAPPIDYPDGVYGRIPPQSIPEERPLIIDPRRKLDYSQQNFVRNNPERRTVGGVGSNDSIQRPIFRRGSLNKPEIYENTSYNKKVSFINNEAAQAWPTKNGYTQSPPQRRVAEREKRESVDDYVFLPNSPRGVGFQNYAYYGQLRDQNESIYGGRVLVHPKQQNEPIYGGQWQQEEQIYGSRPPIPVVDNRVRQQGQYLGPRILSMDSIPGQQDIYVSKNQVPVRLPNMPMKREVIIQDDIYGKFGGYQPQYASNNQLSSQRMFMNPVHSSRQSITEPNYGQKQITVTNKYCDIYGQIHDQMPRGVVMGRLQQSPALTPPQQNFVRGSRLTASANDMGRRYYQNDPIYNSNISYDHRPLPPIPNKQRISVPVSDTESGSDAGEVRRIMQNQIQKNYSNNNKKRGGIFGKL